MSEVLFPNSCGAILELSGENSVSFFFTPQKVEKKDSIKIAAINIEHTRREVRSFLKAKTWSVKGCVIGKGFEVVMNKQIDFVEANALPEVLVTLIGFMSSKRSA